MSANPRSNQRSSLFSGQRARQIPRARPALGTRRWILPSTATSPVYHEPTTILRWAPSNNMNTFHRTASENCSTPWCAICSSAQPSLFRLQQRSSSKLIFTTMQIHSQLSISFTCYLFPGHLLLGIFKSAHFIQLFCQTNRLRKH